MRRWLAVGLTVLALGLGAWGLAWSGRGLAGTVPAAAVERVPPGLESAAAAYRAALAEVWPAPVAADDDRSEAFSRALLEVEGRLPGRDEWRLAPLLALHIEALDRAGRIEEAWELCRHWRWLLAHPGALGSTCRAVAGRRGRWRRLVEGLGLARPRGRPISWGAPWSWPRRAVALIRYGGNPYDGEAFAQLARGLPAGVEARAALRHLAALDYDAAARLESAFAPAAGVRYPGFDFSDLEAPP